MGQRRAYLDFTKPAATGWWQARVQYAWRVIRFDGAMQDYGENRSTTCTAGRQTVGHRGRV